MTGTPRWCQTKGRVFSSDHAWTVHCLTKSAAQKLVKKWYLFTNYSDPLRVILNLFLLKVSLKSLSFMFCIALNNSVYKSRMHHLWRVNDPKQRRRMYTSVKTVYQVHSSCPLEVGWLQLCIHAETSCYKFQCCFQICSAERYCLQTLCVRQACMVVLWNYQGT